MCIHCALCVRSFQPAFCEITLKLSSPLSISRSYSEAQDLAPRFSIHLEFGCLFINRLYILYYSFSIYSHCFVHKKHFFCKYAFYDFLFLCVIFCLLSFLYIDTATSTNRKNPSPEEEVISSKEALKRWVLCLTQQTVFGSAPLLLFMLVICLIKSNFSVADVVSRVASLILLDVFLLMRLAVYLLFEFNPFLSINYVFFLNTL